MPRRSDDEENGTSSAPHAEPRKRIPSTKKRSIVEGLLALASTMKKSDADHRDGAVGSIERGNTELQARTIRLFRRLRLLYCAHAYIKLNCSVSANQVAT